jgi:hypothetical protein
VTIGCPEATFAAVAPVSYSPAKGVTLVALAVATLGAEVGGGVLIPLRVIKSDIGSEDFPPNLEPSGLGVFPAKKCLSPFASKTSVIKSPLVRSTIDSTICF